MEKENLNNVLGVEANSETTSKFVKTGRKFVSVQKHLSAFSVFMRVLIIIIWGGMMLSFLPQHYLAYQMAIGGLMYGLIAAILWFSVGDIYSTKEIIWEEFELQKQENESQVH
ncbi:hypothetical protein [Odoribacter splanchnicus]|jgi:hypothetical protein|uniref:Uncharacterized protein n=1 Tax=Odoribacter splanchnicus TaxID=28118 RepID=A0AAW5CG48_9BACT|nr:hypothetical protein [Odoribacter splanchnicus]OKZ39115.1 MAG: hypothetical protein BHV82_16205 [Odoribacter sp. 43_10]MBV4277133.1 hypothetical protein [Odoribacter splanchnicus]MBV4292503.1 hypothetical protein [Odoribacter splanchnicus]MBV4401954.1 hypothetical protein [Odoribacter splanchnicus]MBV4410664.1 hypothetical protein [Odoribacter splanchnicus]